VFIKPSGRIFTDIFRYEIKDFRQVVPRERNAIFVFFIHFGTFCSLKQWQKIHWELTMTQLFNDLSREKTLVFAKLDLFDSLSQILEIITIRDGYLPLFYIFDYSVGGYYPCNIFVPKVNCPDSIGFLYQGSFVFILPILPIRFSACQIEKSLTFIKKEMEFIHPISRELL
jgi:hypothetical protein